MLAKYLILEFLYRFLTSHIVDKGSRPKNRINHQRYSEADLKKLASTTD